MLEELAQVLGVILNVATVAVAVVTVVVALYLLKLFKGTPFEGPWKILFLVPTLMAGIGVCEILGVRALRIRQLLCLTTILVFLYSLYSFYRVWQRVRAIEVLSPEEKRSSTNALLE